MDKIDKDIIKDNSGSRIVFQPEITDIPKKDYSNVDFKDIYCKDKP